MSSIILTISSESMCCSSNVKTSTTVDWNRSRLWVNMSVKLVASPRRRSEHSQQIVLLPRHPRNGSTTSFRPCLSLVSKCLLYAKCPPVQQSLRVSRGTRRLMRLASMLIIVVCDLARNASSIFFDGNQKLPCLKPACANNSSNTRYRFVFSMSGIPLQIQRLLFPF